MSVSGKVTVITGATGGLGQAVTSAFLTAGSTVAVLYHSEDKLVQLQQSLPSPVTLALRTDVGDEGQVAAAFAQVHEQLGGPQVLLNLVGGYAAGKKVHELDLKTWRDMLDLNLNSAFICTHCALGYMLEQGLGRIINVSSKVAVDLTVGSGAYGVSKAALLSFTTLLAHELKGTGVTANAVLPSVIDTPTARESMPKADFARWVTPQAIAETLLYLASDEAAAVNGAQLPLYGGL